MWAARPLENRIACSRCDLLHEVMPVPEGARAKCQRCGTVLLSPAHNAIDRIISLSVAVAILMVAAVFFPFLKLSTAGLTQNASVVDAVLAFSSGLMVPLSLAVALMIAGLPVLRAAALVYTLAPLRRDRPPFRHASAAFRLADHLKPWSMAEIFIVGVSVALVKVTGLAQVSLGPAFWAFCALVLIVALKDSLICNVTIWQMLDQQRRR